MPPRVPCISEGWLFIERPRPEARVRLLCFPPAGGGTATYQGWDAKLNGGPGAAPVEVAVALMPGRAQRIRDALPETVTAVADAFLGCPAVQRRLLGDGVPVVVFGHSFGAAAAYAVAARASEAPVRGLVVSCRAGPGHRYEAPPWHSKTDAELSARLRALGGTPPEVFEYPELLQMILPAFRGDLRLNERFADEGIAQDGAALGDLPVTYIYGDTDTPAVVGGAEGWRAVARALEVSPAPGGHFYFSSPEGWAALAAVLRRHFEAAAAAPG
eukprot:TRINITY_DN47355_c0_g1_i1.p2 TRINITY_DN47355_c0_g1~~TRINITY_DN47355_c0_g1_i1.p2  ORF type:complete len:272 (+),score=84.28 TRINITY_DN47355_c0_g1_i1:89-904(+)